MSNEHKRMIATEYKDIDSLSLKEVIALVDKHGVSHEDVVFGAKSIMDEYYPVVLIPRPETDAEQKQRLFREEGARLRRKRDYELLKKEFG